MIDGRDVLVILFRERDPTSLGHASAVKMLADIWMFDLEPKTWGKIEITGEGSEGRGQFGSSVKEKRILWCKGV